MNMKKRYMMLTMILCMLINPLSVFADDYEEQTYTEEGTVRATVTATKESSYVIMLPKKVELSIDGNGIASYGYYVKLAQADLEPNVSVKVTSSDFYIANSRISIKIKNDMDFTTGTKENEIIMYNPDTIYYGWLESESSLTAGSYAGTMSFTITMLED